MYSPWGRRESDTTERLLFFFLSFKYQEDTAQKGSVITFHLHAQNRLQAQVVSSGLGFFLALPSAIFLTDGFLKDGYSSS